MAEMEQLLDCRDLHKRFGERTAVDGVSFHIARGETYGLLGPNGAGKTTSISMICGLLERDGGEVTVAGRPVDINAVEAKAAIGYVPQDLAIYPDLSARENLRFFGKLQRMSGAALNERVDAVLELIGLTERADDRTDDYSGGMKRRLNIGIGLLHEPQLLVLDEPTVGVDPQSRNAILEAVEDLRQGGMSILYTTHYMEEAEQLCNRLAIIDHGKLIAEGTANELKSQIGGTVIEVVVPEDERDLAIDTLRRATSEEPMFEPNKRCLVVHAPNGSKTLMEVVRLLDEAGITPDDLEMHKPTLDEVFLTLTGHVAEEAEDDEDAPEGSAAGRSRFGRRSR